MAVIKVLRQHVYPWGAATGVHDDIGTNAGSCWLVCQPPGAWKLDVMDEDRIAGTAKDVTGKLERTVGDMAGDADTKAAGSAPQAAGKVEDLYGQAKDAARDATDAAAGYAKQVYRQSSDSSEAVAKLVQHNPLGSLLIASSIGFALALLMRHPAPRRRRGRYYD
jgi:uncharacterized protein YjbJ (UPF0337 family)